MICLENEKMKAEISLHGAELKSLYRKDQKKEYLWCADPAFWGRSAPVLFPFVGSVRDKKYRIKDVTYPMNQHGFARDREFTLISETENEAWFALEADEESFQVYPFRFRLEIGYRLEGNSVTVSWKVKNPDEKGMDFSIGAHPAFLCPPEQGQAQEDCSVRLYDASGNPVKEAVSSGIGTKGLVTGEKFTYVTDNGGIRIEEHLFDHDALVLENRQVSCAALADPSGKEYVKVFFDMPLVGIWSPAGKKAPFVCIEPWCGRCDAENFAGELSEREWGNHLEAGECFETSYRIEIG